MSVAVASEMGVMALDQSSGTAAGRGWNPLRQNSIILAENDRGAPDDTEKPAPGSENKRSEPESTSAAAAKDRSAGTEAKPLKPFEPSEKIPGEQAVDFPVDI